MAADLSSHTGWAVGEHYELPRFGTFDLPKTGDDVGRFVAVFDEWLCGMISVERPDLLVFEAPLMLGGGRGTTSIVTTRKMMALASHCEFVCHRLGVTCREANVMTVKRFFAGSGRAQKPDMIAAARRYGSPVRDDNQADAVAAWSYQVHFKFADQRHRWAAGQIGAAAA